MTAIKLSLRSWRYCVGARLKFWRQSRVPKKGSRDEAVLFSRKKQRSKKIKTLYNYISDQILSGTPTEE